MSNYSRLLVTYYLIPTYTTNPYYRTLYARVFKRASPQGAVRMTYDLDMGY